MTTHDDLALEWANIDGEGLIRVFPLADFKSGFVMVAHIGLAGEKLGYFPEVLLTNSKLTVTIPPQDEGLDHRLAHAIDATLHDATQPPANQ